jgi:hypothetical protein
LWTVVTSPNISATYTNILSGVTCASASNCWAVGYAFDSNAPQTLVKAYDMIIERWNGTLWTIDTSPNINATHNQLLRGVTCVSASDCWAVGFDWAGGTTYYQTLIERWDGTLWAIVSSPNTSATQYNLLSGVTCVSASNCWAIGNASASGAYQTLIERWDGTSWAIVASPNTSAAQTNFLSSATCVSASDCWAVGSYDNGRASRTLIEEFTIPVQLVSVLSRKTHGSAGTFDVDLTNGNGIECRSGGANGDYTLVFTFANALTSVASASVTSGAGSVSTNNIDINDAHNYIVNLTGVTNARVITVSLSNVTDSADHSSSAVSAQMGVLLGDVNASRRVDAADVSLVRQQTLQPVTSSNFREDVNTSGRIDAADVSVARQQTLTSLP